MGVVAVVSRKGLADRDLLAGAGAARLLQSKCEFNPAVPEVTERFPSRPLLGAGAWASHRLNRVWQGSDEIGAMADLQKLLFETKAKVTDREVMATARLNARVKAFAGRELSDDIMAKINEAVADEADRLIADGVLRERPDWLAVIFRRRLYVAFGSRAVQQLSRELKDMGAV